ncbi:precorrin-3B C(17)-methyltransferase [Tumebacillus flagellatus]|uniref:Cobalt-precorrin-3B C(17)-methyltransferase n=1 Tax=Tumebacillus flagellatus TaxID=1157490 RepID=A0A074LL28_9BACL|nr:precorrin-3B C(17)-methyltransferase [Tumebacillus flagellatus]KEO81809.1 cobalt-precorrin-3B C(17)-methyltransferase [Tumebacillus flagellatus]
MATRGKLLIIGFGPGSFEQITERARTAIQESDVIIGYNTYVDLIRGLLTDQEIVRTGMTEEVSRAIEAVRQAESGKKVAVISSGDAGVYGMAGLVYEVLIEQGWTEATGVEVEVIPGISAINSCASLLGAPVMHDACTISLSDHLTPWEVIAKRVEAAGMGDFIVALYNPRSGRRTRQIVETQRILLKYRSADTPVGLVKSAYRASQQVVLTTLGEMLEHEIGMLTTVIIGNRSTKVYDGKMITPRGYQRKYTLDRAEQPIKMNERLREEHEPWALHGGVSAGRGEKTKRAGSVEEDASRSLGVALAEGANPSVGVALEARANSFGGVAVVEDATEVVNAAAAPARSSADLAMEAVSLLVNRGVLETSVVAREAQVQGDLFSQPLILEIAVSPGVGNKKLTPAQMAVLLDVVGEDGEFEYTPHHYVILRVPTREPELISEALTAAGMIVQPLGDVVQIKACDFCNLEKTESLPQAEELLRRFGGLSVPKELKIGFAGCGMACYGSVNEDIAMVYRRGKFDLFLGGKAIGRNAHPAQRVAEGLEPEQLLAAVEEILAAYKGKGHPDERFHKFFKRVGDVAGFHHEDYQAPLVIESICGD